MAEAPRAGDLRLSIPSGEAYVAIACEVAVRFAEYAGVAQSVATEFGKAVERLAAKMNGADIELAMEPRERVLTVRITADGAAAETSCPLPE